VSSGALRTSLSQVQAIRKEKKEKKETSNTEAVVDCCTVTIGDSYLWQVSVCWEVPSVIEVGLLYVKAHGSRSKRNIPQVSALTLVH